jgi:hypothetical protein
MSDSSGWCSVDSTQEHNASCTVQTGSANTCSVIQGSGSGGTPHCSTYNGPGSWAGPTGGVCHVQ